MHIILRLDDKCVGLIQAANTTIHRRRDQASAALRGPLTQMVSLDRIESHDVVQSMPFDRAQRLK